MSWPFGGSKTFSKQAKAYLKSHVITDAAAHANALRYMENEDAIAIPFPGTDAGVMRMLAAEIKFKAPHAWETRMYLAPLPPGSGTDWERVKKDPRVPIYCAEGPIKGLAFSWHAKRPTIAFNGLDGWGSGNAPIDDFKLFVWKDRLLVIVVDSDAAAKTSAQQSLRRFETYLLSLGARVLVKIVPALKPGFKTDVNDFIAARGIDALLAIEETAMPDDWGAHEATKELNEKLILLKQGRGEAIMVLDDLKYPGTKRIRTALTHKLAVEYLSERVTVGWKKNGDDIVRTKFEVWLGDPYHRWACDIALKPGAPWGIDPKTHEFNLWSGWAVTPHKPDAKHRWTKFQGHIREVVASGDKRVSEYMFNWMAHGIQHPATLPEVALVFMGGEGIGKGTFAQGYARLFGRHFKHLEQAGQLTGRFNEEMNDKMLIFADETFFAGDHAAASTLKTMISEKTMTIEPKFVNAYTLPNYRKFILASNESWVVPAGPDARRYAVFQVSEHRKGDHDYFRAMFDELESGGYEAMLYDLLHRDISSFKPQCFPQTQALFDQKRLSFDPITQWWFDKLYDGVNGVVIERVSKESGAEARVTPGWNTTIVKADIIDELWPNSLKRDKETRRFETLIGMKLPKLCRGIKAGRHWNNKTKKQDQVFLVPKLEECRREFERYTQSTIDWSTGEISADGSK